MLFYILYKNDLTISIKLFKGLPWYNPSP